MDRFIRSETKFMKMRVLLIMVILSERDNHRLEDPIDLFGGVHLGVNTVFVLCTISILRDIFLVSLSEKSLPLSVWITPEAL